MLPFSPWVGHFWIWQWNANTIKEVLKTCLIIGLHFNADLIVPVIWSLVVEMQMSLVLPFFIILVSKSKGWYNILFFIITLILIYNRFVGFLGVFYLGILLAKYRHYFIAKIQSFSTWVIVILVCICIAAYNIGGWMPYNYQDHSQSFQFFWRDYVNALSCCLIIIIAITKTRTAVILTNKVFTFLGDISYSFYLLHLPILITVTSVCSAIFLPGLFICIFIDCGNNSSLFIIQIYRNAFSAICQSIGEKTLDKVFQNSIIL